jgi:hypothetical protein
MWWRSLLNSEHLVYVSGSPSPDNTTGEPTAESDIDSSAAVALITISKGSQGNAVISPQTTTIKTGGEIFILNNDSVVQLKRMCSCLFLAQLDEYHHRGRCILLKNLRLVLLCFQI